MSLPVALLLLTLGATPPGEAPVDPLAAATIGSTDRVWFPPPLPPGKVRVGGLPDDVTGEVLLGSEEWVFVLDGLAVPRARLQLSLPAAEGRSAALVVAGRTAPLARDGERLVIDTLVPLLSSARAGLVLIRRDGEREERTQLTLELPAGPTQLAFEPNCQRARLSLREASGEGGVLFAHCLVVRHGPQFDRRREVQLRLAWDAARAGLTVDGVAVAPESPGVYRLRVIGPDATLALSTPAGDRAVLQLSLPPETSDGSFGLGIGPYLTRFREEEAVFDDVAGLLTAYAAYRVSDTARVVFFGANDLSDRVAGDYGLYFSYESLRLFDDRVRVILLPGVHGLAMRELDGDFHSRLSFPQGFELKWEGPFRPGHYVALGGFVDPYILRTGYTNLWLRYGPPDLFAEVNLLGWETELDDGSSVSWIAAGVSVGFRVFDIP